MRELTLTEARKEFTESEALKTAWIDFIAGYDTGFLSLEEYCRTHKLHVGEAEIPVSYAQFRRMHAKLKRHGSPEDRRQFNKGRPGMLSSYCKYSIFEDYLNFENLSVSGHLRLLNLRLEHDRSLSEDSKSPKFCTYDQVRRFLKTIPEIYAVYAKEGYKAAREKFGPAPSQAVRYIPGQLWVVDTVTLKQLKFRFKEDSGNEVIKSPQITFILDAASTECVYAKLHWDTADSGTFIDILQGALLPERRHQAARGEAFPISDAPVMLLSDRGTVLHNDAVIQVCHELGITKRRSRPRCPEENSKAETFAKVLSNAFQEKLLFHIRKLVPKGIEVSDLAKLVESRFYQWVTDYNQTPEKRLQGLSPIEYVREHGPQQPLNRHSREELLAATRVIKLVTASSGLFKYNAEIYRCTAIGHLGKIRVTIKVDPYYQQPAKIEVFQGEMLLGVATSDPFDATGMNEKPDLQDAETTAMFKGQLRLAKKLKTKTPILTLPAQEPAAPLTTEVKPKAQHKPAASMSSATLIMNFAGKKEA